MISCVLQVSRYLAPCTREIDPGPGRPIRYAPSVETTISTPALGFVLRRHLSPNLDLPCNLLGGKPKPERLLRHQTSPKLENLSLPGY